MKQGCKMSGKGVIRDFLAVQGLGLGAFTVLALSKNNLFFFFWLFWVFVAAWAL